MRGLGLVSPLLRLPKPGVIVIDKGWEAVIVWFKSKVSVSETAILHSPPFRGGGGEGFFYCSDNLISLT